MKKPHVVPEHARLNIHTVVLFPVCQLVESDTTVAVKNLGLLQLDVLRPMLQQTEAVAWAVYYTMLSPDGQDDSAIITKILPSQGERQPAPYGPHPTKGICMREERSR